MQKIIELLRQKKWSPFFTLPLTFALSVAIIPYFTHQLHFVHIVTLSLMGILGIVAMFGLAWLHRVPMRSTAIFVVIGCGLVILKWPKEQLGNWNMQLSDHIMQCALTSFLMLGFTLFLQALGSKKTTQQP